MFFVLMSYIITIISIFTTSSIQDVPSPYLLLHKPKVTLISILLWACVCFYFCNKMFHNKLVYSVDCDRSNVFSSVVIIYFFYQAGRFSITYCKRTPQDYDKISASIVFICHGFVNTLYTLYLNYKNILIYCLG